MNKKLLGGITLVALVTSSYYASAAGLPRVTLGAPIVGPTTSYAPGTPDWLEYPGSPYRIGGPHGPHPGESWAVFTASRSASVTATSSSSRTPSSLSTSSGTTTPPISSSAQATPDHSSTVQFVATPLWTPVTITVGATPLHLAVPASWATHATYDAVPTGSYWAWGNPAGYQSHPSGFFNVHVMTETGPAATQTLPGPWPHSYASSVESVDAAQFGVAQSYAVPIDGQWVVIDITVPANHPAWLSQIVQSVRW